MNLTAFGDRIFELFGRAAEKAPELLLTFIVGYIVIKFIKLLIHGAIQVSRANAALKGILMSVIDIALWIFLLAAMLSQVGLTQIAFVLSGSVAIAGIAISAGSASFVQDLVSGIFLSQDPDFNVGDQLQIKDIDGVVERMDARKIRLRDKSGKLHVFPNSTFDKESWIVVQKKGRG